MGSVAAVVAFVAGVAVAAGIGAVAAAGTGAVAQGSEPVVVAAPCYRKCSAAELVHCSLGEAKSTSADTWAFYLVVVLC